MIPTTAKLALATAAASLTLLATARPADACSPADTCGFRYCYQNSDGLVSGTLVGRNPPMVTIQIASVHGNTGTLAAGTTVDLNTFETFEASDVGRTFHLLVRTNTDSTLEIAARIDPQAAEATECFGADAPAATVADVVLSPMCFDILEPGYQDPCSDTGCSAGGPGAGVPVLLALVTFAVGGRRRRGHRAR